MSNQPAGPGLTAEQIYRAAAPGVVLITDTHTQRLPATLFGGPPQQQVRVLGSGFVVDDAIQTDAAINHGNSGGPLIDRPAAKAGLVAGQIAVDGQTAVVDGDAIVSVDGKPIASASALTNAVAAHRPGDTIRVGIVRAGETRRSA